MKFFMTSAIAMAAIGAMTVSAIADDRPAPKGPAKTMGDQGKLPASETMRNAVPDMTGPSTGSSATGENTGPSGSASPKGPAHRMGDEAGKLPATGTVSGAVPEMRGAAPEGK
ncbi:hypothetical protein [Hyphomicrobium sp.]|uniref:hypothetical protein n=1 Tax=Hyphomicrobium sp. TaxID=82 RepID=UPI002FDDEE55